jgi:hypothetical protein
MANGYQPSYGSPALMHQRGEVFSARPVRDPVQTAKDMVYRYNREPKKFTDEQAERIAFIAARLGLPFKGESKALQKFFFDVVDNMAFGALPESARPVSRGESIYGETGAEKVAGVASLLGYAVPGAIGARLGTRALSAGMQRIPGRAGAAMRRGMDASAGAGGLTAAGRPISPGILNRMVTGGAAGAGALALSDIVEDPFGAPSRALTGAAFGGALGAVGALGKGTAMTFNEPLSPGPKLLGPGATRIPQRAATTSEVAFGAGRGGGRAATQYIYPDGRSMTTMRPEAIGTEFRVGSIIENPGQVRKVFLEYAPTSGRQMPGWGSQLNLFNTINRPPGLAATRVPQQISMF